MLLLRCMHSDLPSVCHSHGFAAVLTGRTTPLLLASPAAAAAAAGAAAAAAEAAGAGMAAAALLAPLLAKTAVLPAASPPLQYNMT